MAFVVSVVSVLSCRQIVGIQPRGQISLCSDKYMIDDLEDGDALLCESPSTGRDGNWFKISGKGTSTNLEPAEGPAFTRLGVYGIHL